MKLVDQADIIKRINNAANPGELEKIRIYYLGRQGVLTESLKKIAGLPAAQRPQVGAKLNSVKKTVEGAIKQRQTQLLNNRLQAEGEIKLDLSAPAGGHQLGHPHPIKELEKQLVQAFWQLGFTVADGPEIENEWYNFEALNIPDSHPARDMFDTFYLGDGRLLRTHTSPVQVRYMETNQPPIRIVSLGRVYRHEDEDATHLAVFRQMEGLVIDRGVNLGDLKGTLLYMFRSILDSNTRIKLMPSYFPFVEPALEVHISCVVCAGKQVKCKTCKGVGWIEMCGAGMVHPRVLNNMGINNTTYSGFAFGAGLERIAATKYGIPDIRHFYRPDLRFIGQFK